MMNIVKKMVMMIGVTTSMMLFVGCGEEPTIETTTTTEITTEAITTTEITTEAATPIAASCKNYNDEGDDAFIENITEINIEGDFTEINSLDEEIDNCGMFYEGTDIQVLHNGNWIFAIYDKNIAIVDGEEIEFFEIEFDEETFIVYGTYGDVHEYYY